MGRNWILFSRSEQGRKRYATRRVSIEPSEAGVSPAPAKMAAGEDEDRGILDEPSILKSRDHREKNRPESAPICNLGGQFNEPRCFTGLLAFFAQPATPG